MSVATTLLSYEQRESVDQAVEDFTCRGPRHEDDPTVDFGDKYIKEGVWAELDECSVTRTWAAIVEGKLVGYLALASDAVRLTRGERHQADLDAVSTSRYGCTQIHMLAVRAEFHEHPELHVGRALVEQAILVAKKTGDEIGARFLAADVNPPAQGFYERCGFVSLAGESEELEDKRKRGMVPMILDLRPPSN